jgi:hypothetical protein
MWRLNLLQAAQTLTLFKVFSSQNSGNPKLPASGFQQLRNNLFCDFSMEKYMFAVANFDNYVIQGESFCHPFFSACLPDDIFHRPVCVLQAKN